MIDPEPAKCLFTFTSAAFELAGLGFVAKEIGAARQHARNVLRGKSGTELRLRIGRAAPGDLSESKTAPTTWASLQNIEQVQSAQNRAIRQLGDELQADIDQVRNETLQAATARDSALRDLIALQEGGSIRLRVIGAICIAIGIVLAIPANLVG